MGAVSPLYWLHFLWYTCRSRLAGSGSSAVPLRTFQTLTMMTAMLHIPPISAQGPLLTTCLPAFVVLVVTGLPR